jgi:hypothetical protein
MRIAVAQLGARMHYAVPKLFERAGILERFYTDLDAGQGWPRLAQPLSSLPGGGGLRRFLGRIPDGLPKSKVSAFNTLGLAYALRRSRARTAEQQAAVFLWVGRAFCRSLIRQGLGGATHTFSYNSAGLEWMRFARSKGLKTVMEQTIAPKEFELRLLRSEQQRFPGWEQPLPADATGAVREFCERERAEWAEADLILCGSQFVMEGIRECGGPVERCVVVPYGVDPSPEAPKTPKKAGQGRLKVLTVGAVGLRKGSPVVMETAMRCKDFCEFRMVGPLTAAKEALDRLSSQVSLTGPVPRSSIKDHYAWADVFFLPSVCEGSATVIYEALACGLPVLTTPNSGSVVSHGEDGWLAPLGEVETMAGQLLWMHQNRAALELFSARALKKAQDYDTASYGRRLLHALEKV